MTEWPERWIDRVRLYRTRIREEVFRLNSVSPPPRTFADTTRLGRNIGRAGRLLSFLPLREVRRDL